MSVEPELTMVLTDIDGISTLQSPKLDAVIEQVAVARAHAIRSGGGLPVARAGMGDAIWWLRSGIQPIDAAFCLRAHAEFAGRLLAAEGTDFPLHGPVVMAQGSGVRLPSIEHAVADSEVVDGDLSADITTDYVYSPAFKDMWLAMEGWWKALGPGALLVLCRNQDGAVHTAKACRQLLDATFPKQTTLVPEFVGLRDTPSGLLSLGLHRLAKPLGPKATPLFQLLMTTGNRPVGAYVVRNYLQYVLGYHREIGTISGETAARIAIRANSAAQQVPSHAQRYRTLERWARGCSGNGADGRPG